jgi:transcriptional antiterminator Rof (Rho-off)
LDELSPQQTVRSSKRMKRVVQQTVSKPSSEPEVDEQVEAEGIDDRQAAILLSKNRPRRSPRRISEASPDLDLPIPSVQNKRRGKHQFEPSPAQQRQPKANPKTKKQSSKPVIKDYGSPIPVIVHRLAQATNFSDDNFDVDVLNLKIPRAKRGDPNAVDVLSQVCEEIVTSALEALSENAKRSSDPAVRREYKTKYHGVEAFGRELQIRLLEHVSFINSTIKRYIYWRPQTINLDNGDSLQRRLRDEQKRKLTLREQISHIRAEREQVALKMDKIRIRHENETKKVLVS